MKSSTARTHTEHVVLELHPKEVELLLLIRNQVRYGEITIKTRDGLPARVLEFVRFHDLDGGDKRGLDESARSSTMTST